MHCLRGTWAAVRVRWAWFEIVAIAIAVAVGLWHPGAAWVEQHYTNGFYSALDPALRAITGLVPFAVGDALLLAAVAALIAMWTIGLRMPGHRWKRVPPLALRTLAGLAIVFVWFEGFWALNYGRVPIADKVIVSRSAVDSDTVNAFADRVVRMLDANVVEAHAVQPSEADVRRALQPTFEAAIHRLGDERPFGLPNVKPTIFDLMLGTTGDSGFMDPWTHEVNLYSGQLFFERPSTFAHEWAHAAGFADESEANYVSVLACINSPLALARYSGWLLVWFNLPSDVHVTARARRQVVLDVEAIKARYQRQVQPAVARAQQAAYDRYLRANRVKQGIDSYRLFVRWMAGATYDAQGLPVVRPDPAAPAR
jgi:hypothetical protein